METPAMASTLGRRYLVEELVSLRTSAPAANSVLEKLKSHPDISSLYKISQGGMTANNRPPLYNSKSLSEITNRQKARQNVKKDVTDSSEDSEFQHVADQNSDHDHRHVHWNFRKRDSSDHSSQPHSAPTEIAAQQSENFQRFYRAVVSPTHVRVTAGGRIVPNTRTVAPPLFDWNGDKFRFEPKKSTADLEPYPSQPSPWPLSASFPTGYPSLMPGGFLPAFNFLPKNASIALPQMASQIQHAFTGELVSTERSQTPQVNGDTTSIPQGALPQSVKISHPSQFDHTKPFTFNGHIVYPLPPGFQPPQNAVPLPINMLTGNMMTQAPVTVPQASGYLPTQFSVLPSPYIFQQPSQQVPIMISPSGNASENSAAPMGIVPVSELLGGQIQILRGQLKNTEDMISSHSNPMGENIMNQQRAILLGQISTLESFLQTQVAQEELSKKILTSNNSEKLAGPQNGLSTIDSSFSKKENTAERQNIKDETEISSKQNLKPDPTTKSRLTLAAAMAPPFKPRAKNVAANASNGIASSTNSPELAVLQSPETDEQIEARLLSKSDTDWGQPSIFGNSEMSFTFPHAQSFPGGSTEYPTGTTVPSFQRCHTYSGPGTTPSVGPVLTNQPLPYLIGTLPRGIPATMIKPDDIAYSRPLTEDEVRARYLYWGKAPRSVQSGLPKFDGKDFYPPSPIKEHIQPVVQNNQQVHVSTLVDPNGTPGPVDFSKLFEGYKTPSPVHRLHLQNIRPLAPVPQPIFGKKASPAQDISPQNGSVKSGWSATYGEDHDQPHTPPPVTAQSNTHSKVDPEEDFSQLFITKSPSPPRSQATSSKEMCNGRQQYSPGTPSNLGLRQENIDDDEVRTQGSWGRPSQLSNGLAVQTPESPGDGTHSSESTVEIQLSPRVKPQMFAERVESFRTPDQQTLFLQNMLKSQPPMTTSALSGAITSATAQGYLPQYRGSAAASLAPAMHSVPATNSSLDHSTSKPATGKMTTSSVSPLVVSSIMAENQPLGHKRSVHGLASEVLGAEEYMRYLTKKEDLKKKTAEQGWGSSENDVRTGNGPGW